MARKTLKENYRVVVWPRHAAMDSWGVNHNPERLEELRRERCEEMVPQIQRHVNDVGTVEVAYDTRNVCEHCGERWTEDSPDYNGGCCDKDVEAEEARRAGGEA